eukprot:gb/GECG01010828.1/.p1 GENE.gb/GECG01010828.1/~~gb/GECG01010828.1/.p1  ORF type:complete len:292 (+),score=40.09 gb/GECG01010828.1/:1-876(+)
MSQNLLRNPADADSTSSSTTTKAMLDEYHRTGHRLLFDDGLYTEAITWFDRVLQLDPNYMDSYMFKGQALLLRGPQWPGSQANPRTTASVTSVSWNPLEHNVQAAEEALTYGFMPVLDFDQQDMEAQLWGGIACIECGKHDQALEMLEKAAALSDNKNPRFDYKSSVDAHKHRLNGHKHLRDLPQADEQTSLAVGTQRTHDMYNASLEELGKGMHVADINGEDSQFLRYDRGCIFILMNDFKSALEEFNSVKSETGQFARPGFKNTDQRIQDVINLINAENTADKLSARQV